MGWPHYLGPFPNWDSRLLLTRDFPALFKSGCRSAQFGDIYAVIFSIVSFNDYILKLSQISYKKLKLFL